MTEMYLPAIYVDAGFTGAVDDAVVFCRLEPMASSVGWPLDTGIYILIADISAGNALDTKTKVWVNDELAFEQGGAPQFKSGWDGGGSSFTKTGTLGSVVDDLHAVTIDPTSMFGSSEVVTVRVRAESTGAYVFDETYTFTTRDAVAPTITDVLATSPTRVRVTYDEPVRMDDEAGGALDEDNYTLAVVDTPAFLPSAFDVEQVNNYEVELVFDDELTHGRTYRLTVADVEDVEGNPIVEDDYDFVAADLTVTDRDFGIWDRVPAKLRRLDTATTGGSPGDTERLLACFQDVVDLLWDDVDLLARMYDPNLAPMDAVNLLLRQLGNPFDIDMTDTERRKLLLNLVYIYRQKGTEAGIENAIFFFMGITVTITRPWARSWRLGHDKLGYTTRLGPGTSYDKFMFWVECPISLTTLQRTSMHKIINLMKVGHEHHLINEPTPPPPSTWRIGYDKLGYTTRLGS